MSKFVFRKSGYQFNEKGEYVRVDKYRESEFFDWEIINNWKPFGNEREYTDVYKFYDGENHGELFFSDFYMAGMCDMILIPDQNNKYKVVWKWAESKTEN